MERVGEVSANLTRSRHCDWEAARNKPLGTLPGKAREKAMIHQSGDLLVRRHRMTYGR